MGYLRYNDSLTEKFYNADSVVILGKSCHERAYDEMLIALQPLAVLPFQLSTEYVIQHSNYQHKSPSQSPIKNKPSPGISPTVERKGFGVNDASRVMEDKNNSDPTDIPYKSEDNGVVVPPPKPARVDKTGLVSTKAWEWLKGVPQVRGSQDSREEGSKGVGKSSRDDLEQKSKECQEQLYIDESKLSKESGNIENKSSKGTPSTKTSVPHGATSTKTSIPMTESFSGIAQKLFGIGSSKEKSEGLGNQRLNSSQGSIPQMQEEFPDNTPKLTRQSSMESVSNKAKSSLIKLFDKLLLSRENTPKPADVSENRKSSSWNFGFSQTEQGGKPKSMIPTSKSLSPVSNHGSGYFLKKPNEGIDKKIPTKSRSENVVAKSIQKEAKKSGRNSEVKKQQTVINNLLSKEKSSIKKETIPNGSPGKRVIPKAEKPQAKMNENTSVVQADVAQSSSKKQTSDRSKVSKIPTLRNSPTSSVVKRREKPGSKVPKRHSLVLDSSGSDVGSPNTNAVNSPVKVRHSKSADVVCGIPNQGPSSPAKKTVYGNKERLIEKPTNFKSVESSEIRNSIELVKMGQKSNSKKVEEKCSEKSLNSVKSENNSTDSNKCSFTSSSEQCASLELGPTLVVPPCIRESLEKSDPKWKEKPQNDSAAADTSFPSTKSCVPPNLQNVQDMQNIELDINSNSPLPVETDTRVRACEENKSQDAAVNQDCSAKQTDSGEFSKPNFR